MSSLLLWFAPSPKACTLGLSRLLSGSKCFDWRPVQEVYLRLTWCIVGCDPHWLKENSRMDLNVSLTFCSHALFFLFLIQTVVAAIMVHLSTELIVKSRKPVKRKLSSQEYLRTVTHLHLSNKNIEDIVSTHYVNSVLSFIVYLHLI